jgi:hypothetical protein
LVGIEGEVEVKVEILDFSDDLINGINEYK